MAEITAVVPEGGLERTGRISFRFLVEADGLPDETFGLPFGFLWRHAKDENYIAPFKLAHNEPGAVGDDGVPRWQINLFKQGPVQGDNLLMAGGVDSVDGESGLNELLGNIDDDCVVLVPEEDIEPVELAFEGLGHTLHIVRHAGSLKTS